MNTLRNIWARIPISLKVFLVIIVCLLIWHLVSSIQYKRQLSRKDQLIDDLYKYNDSLITVSDTYYTKLVHIEEAIKGKDKELKNIQGILEGWYEITGTYNPLEFEGIATDTVFADSIHKVSFSKDAGSLHIKGWTRTPPPTFGIDIKRDPLTLKIGIERRPSGLRIGHILSSDPEFKISNAEIEEIYIPEQKTKRFTKVLDIGYEFASWDYDTLRVNKFIDGLYLQTEAWCRLFGTLNIGGVINVRKQRTSISCNLKFDWRTYGTH